MNPTFERGQPVVKPQPEEPEELFDYLHNYLPIKFGSALFSKLNREYWNLEHVRGKPLGFAIQDFHSPASMTVSGTALLEYVFGRRAAPLDNSVAVTGQRTVPIENHTYGGKEIPSGFFYQPSSENIGAVFSNPAATISKFNRIGVLGGFGSPRVRLLRVGNWYDHSPGVQEPLQLREEVEIGEYSETWVEGLNVFLNWQAEHPFDPNSFPGAAIHFQENDQSEVRSFLPDRHPYR